ncbi:MAG: O-antigen ligase family protein [Patescibacteria group bacterium]
MRSIEFTLRWLFPLFAFLLPLQTRWIVRDEVVGGSAWEYGRVSLYGFDIVLVVIAILILVQRYRRVLLEVWYLRRGCRLSCCGTRSLRSLKQSSRRNAAPRGSHAFTLIAAIFVVYELAIALDPVLTGVVMLRIALIVIAGQYLFQQDMIMVRRTYAAFVVAMVISSGFGAAQFIMQDDLVSSKWLGVAPQEASTLGVSVVEAAGGRWLRAHGTMPHPNSLGGFAALALAFFLALRTTSMGVREQSNPFLEWCRSIFLNIAPIILIAGVIMSVSRTAILACIGVVGFFLWRVLPKVSIPLRKGVVAFTLGGALIIFLALPALSVRFLALGRLEVLSFTKRAAAFTEALVVFRDHWVTGTGLGGITVAMRERFPALPIWDVQPVHNIPLLILIELGVGGVILLGLGWFIFVKIQNPKSKIQNKFQIQNYKCARMLPVVACYTVLAILDHYLWTLPAGLYLTGFVGMYALTDHLYPDHTLGNRRFFSSPRFSQLER